VQSKKLRKINVWQDYISHEIDISKEFDPDFNIPKIHLRSHLVAQIRRYGALELCCAEGHAQAHKTNLKDGWNDSNYHFNYQLQVITFQSRILCFKITERNLQALAQRRENSAAPCKVLPSGADLASPLGSQSYAKPEFIGPQNRPDGKHPDAMIKDFRALLNNIQDVTHHVAIYSGMQGLIKHKSRKKTYQFDEQLQAIALCIYPGIEVEVEGVDGERISQMCRCTESQSWRQRDRRNDWVWVKQLQGSCYGALNGSLPWQLQ